MALTNDIVVIGGGAAGAACARELALAGRRVLVLEPGGAMGQAWSASAGMLAAQIEADGSDPLFGVAVRARDYYDLLALELRNSTGIDLALWREGIARIATDQGEAETLQRKVAWQKAQGYACDWLDRRTLERRWPWLGPTAGALLAPNDGALNPEHLVQALLADARRRGATLVQDRAIAVEAAAGRVSGVVGGRGRYPGREVVLAAGAWSPRIQGLPRILPIRPIRGQMAALPWPFGSSRAIVYHEDCYILARGDEAILGSTMEDAGLDPEVTPEGLEQIIAKTTILYPELDRSKIRRSWAGLRPVTSDGLPVVGEEPELPGLWYAAGYGRNGILLAGFTGKILTQLICRKPVDFDLSAWAPARFPLG